MLKFIALFFSYFLWLNAFSWASNLSHLVNEFEYRDDTTKENKAKQLHPNSHINIFLPSIPYSYIAKSTNAGLIRSYDNEQVGFMI